MKPEFFSIDCAGYLDLTILNYKKTAPLLNDSSVEVPSLKYSCYLTALETVPEKQGYFRLLETNRRIVLPANTHLRLLVTSADG